MPIYEYECESCRIRFERFQHFKDEPIRECPECGGSVHRLLQPVGIIFKGSGFYITDHRQLSSAASPAKKELQAPKGAEETKSLTAADTSKPAEAASPASKPAKKEAAD